MRLRVGLVGAGTMGARHARVLAASDTAELAWIADPDPVVGETLANETSTKWIPQVEFGGVDALVVAAPTLLHHAIVVEAASCGLPVLVEKPLAESYALTLEMVAASCARGTVLMCGLSERFNPTARRALEVCDQPVSVSTVRHNSAATRRGGVTSDLLIHDLDIVARVMKSSPTTVTGWAGFWGGRDAGEDIVQASMSFAGDGAASLVASRGTWRRARTLTITEPSRSIAADLIEGTIVISENTGSLHEVSVACGPEPLELQWQHFVDLVCGRGDIDGERESVLAPHALAERVRLAAGVGA